MKPALKQAWVKALRSGEYEQGQRYLCQKGKKWCCLGVLCNLPEVPGEWVGDAYSYGDGGTYGSALPPSLSKALGLSMRREVALIGMNDGKGFDFDTIADWIEKNL